VPPFELHEIPTKNLYLLIFIRSSMFILDNRIIPNNTYAYNHTSVWWEKERPRVARIWNRALRILNVLSMSFRVSFRHAANIHFFRVLWEQNSLYEHRPSRVHVIDEVVPPIILVTVHHEVHLDTSPLKHVGKQQWLVEHIHVVVRSCH
jgi:hypothetical protein